MASDPLDAATDLSPRLRELAELDRPDYERRRAAAAKELGIRVAVLDREVDAVRREIARQAPGGQSGSPVEVLAPWGEPVDGNLLADEIRASLKDHVIFGNPRDADAVTLWIMGAFLMPRWHLWPKLLIRSPEKRCGKSTLLEVLEAHLPRALLCSNISVAALFRTIEAWSPSLLIDEADTFLRQNDEAAGIVNSGHTRRTARVIRTVEIDGQFMPQAFSTWCPMAVASIGRQRDTLEDRSIVVNLRRRLPSETVVRLRPDTFERHRDRRRKLLRWAQDVGEALPNVVVEAPDLGNSRASDNWTPLYRVAEALGGPWPERAAAAYRARMSADEDGEDSAGTMLLWDLSEIFDESGTSRLTSTEIVSRLARMEDRPWPDWRNGRPLSTSGLAKLLKPFGIVPRTHRFGSTTAKGYERQAIIEAAERYASPHGDREAVTPKHGFDVSDLATPANETTPPCVSSPHRPNALKSNACYGVTASRPASVLARAAHLDEEEGLI